jgi:hypothetical protein
MTTVDAATSSLEDARESLYEAIQSQERKKYRKSDADNAIDEARFVIDEVSKVLKATDG